MQNNDERMIQHICFNIDRSGSMSGKESDTVGGINTMINELKENKKINEDIYISVKLFDHEEVLKLRKMKIEEIYPFTVADFKPRGQTALLDALGNSLNYFMQEKIKNPNMFKKCLIVTSTDGRENCSKIFTSSQIKSMISEANEKYNIDCIYLGANQDAILHANNIGIAAECAINYDETAENIQAVYRSAASVANRVRTGERPSFTNVERQSSQPTSPPSYNRAIEVPRIARQQAQSLSQSYATPVHRSATR